jgi:hypothetical protein
MHGGKCTGPRTPEGKARSIAAHTTHGGFTAPKREMHRYVRTLAARMRLLIAAVRLRQHLPAEMAMRLALGPMELRAPDHPSQVAFWKNADPKACNLRKGDWDTRRTAAARRAGRAARLARRDREVERQGALVEAEGQAPWRQAIAFARVAKREARVGERAAREVRGAARAGAAARAKAARAAGGATRIARPDLLQRETEGSVRVAPPSPAERARCTWDTLRPDRMQNPPPQPVRAMFEARFGRVMPPGWRVPQAWPPIGGDRAAAGATRIARPDVIQRETEGPVRVAPPSPASLRDATLVRSSRPKPAVRARCSLATVRPDRMQSLPH